MDIQPSTVEQPIPQELLQNIKTFLIEPGVHITQTIREKLNSTDYEVAELINVFLHQCLLSNQGVVMDQEKNIRLSYTEFLTFLREIQDKKVEAYNESQEQNKWLTSITHTDIQLGSYLMNHSQNHPFWYPSSEKTDSPVPDAIVLKNELFQRLFDWQ